MSTSATSDTAPAPDPLDVAKNLIGSVMPLEVRDILLKGIALILHEQAKTQRLALQHDMKVRGETPFDHVFNDFKTMFKGLGAAQSAPLPSMISDMMSSIFGAAPAQSEPPPAAVAIEPSKSCASCSHVALVHVQSDGPCVQGDCGCEKFQGGTEP